MKESQYPPGWDLERVNRVIAYYDAQTEDEEAEEIEAALDNNSVMMVAVPNELVEKVRALIARERGA